MMSNVKEQFWRLTAIFCVCVAFTQYSRAEGVTTNFPAASP